MAKINDDCQPRDIDRNRCKKFAKNILLAIAALLSSSTVLYNSTPSSFQLVTSTLFSELTSITITLEPISSLRMVSASGNAIIQQASAQEEQSTQEEEQSTQEEEQSTQEEEPLTPQPEPTEEEPLTPQPEPTEEEPTAQIENETICPNIDQMSFTFMPIPDVSLGLPGAGDSLGKLKASEPKGSCVCIPTNRCCCGPIGEPCKWCPGPGTCAALKKPR
jgi:hypothetical protein